MRICDPISIMKVGRQHIPKDTKRERKRERERERANGKQWLTLEN